MANPLIATLLMATLLVKGDAMAADPPAAGAVGTSPWSTGTRPPADSRPREGGTTTIRVYEGFGTAGPLYGAPTGSPAYAIDVNAEFGICGNGSRVITAIQVAGARYPLDARCPAGQVPAPAPGPATDASTAASAPTPPVAAIRCDARTWNCRSSP
jgi:hypothetical protein